MPKSDYTAFFALDPFFDVVMEGLSKFVDGEHYFVLRRRPIRVPL